MRKLKPIQALFGLCVFSGWLMLMSIPLWFAIVIGGIVAYFLSRSRETYAIALVASSLLIGFVGVEILLRTHNVQERPQYYRPHEMLLARGANGMMNYERNRRIEDFSMPFGDLGAMSKFETIMEPRTIKFYTDSLGFRNEKDYAGEKLVIFGDSFVVGNGTDQEAIVSEVLTKKLRIRTYNAAFSTGIEGYVARVEFLKQRYGDSFRAIILIFEGNDFPCEEEDSKARSAERRRVLFGYVPPFVRELESYRLFYGLTRRASYVLGGDSLVSVHRVGGNDLGFYKKYIKVTKRQRGCGWSPYPVFLRRVLDQVDLLVFVPTKYRVYHPLMADPENDRALPNIQAEFVERMARDLSVPYLDLTPHLISASKRLLEEGKYTFWRDDTHWNEHGIEVAAQALTARLQ